MQLDQGREIDLEMLYSDYQSEQSKHGRELIEKTISKILNESGASRRLRDELIRATRVNDRNQMEYLRLELRNIDANYYNNNIQL